MWVRKTTGAVRAASIQRRAGSRDLPWLSVLIAIALLLGACGLASSRHVLASSSSGTQVIPPSYFGLTLLNFTQVAPSLVFGAMRSWDAYPAVDWADENPRPGVYDFASLDKLIQAAHSHNAELIYTLGRTPPWASSQPQASGAYGRGQCAPPRNIADWDAYVTAVVTHAGGKIQAWELWNEPVDPHFYCGDIPTLVVMAKHAYKIIKTLSPNSMVLSPAVTGGPGPGWLNSFLSLGGKDAVDVISFHGYWSSRAEDIHTLIGNYRQVMERNGVGSMPLWDTEASWAGFGKPITDPGLRAAFLAKYYLLQWSDGVTRFFWYAYDGGNIWGGLWNSSQGLHRDGIAYGQVYRWMTGATQTAPCSADAQATWSCKYARTGGYQAEAIWNSRTDVAVPVPPGMTEYRDLAGGVQAVGSAPVRVGTEPILFESRPLPK